MKWTEMEENILRKYYPIEGSEVANRLPNRTRKSCINMHITLIYQLQLKNGPKMKSIF